MLTGVVFILKYEDAVQKQSLSVGVFKERAWWLENRCATNWAHLRATAFVDPAQTGTNNEEQPRGGIVKISARIKNEVGIVLNFQLFATVKSPLFLRESNICFSGRSSQRYKLLTAFGHLKKMSNKILRRDSKLIKEFRKNEVWSLSPSILSPKHSLFKGS